MASTPRLTAILAADVVGYLRLMDTDEEGTHERIKRNSSIREHRVRIVRTTADGVLAEFDGVVDAVRCAGEYSTRRRTEIWISPRSPACAFASGSISAT